MCVCVSMPHSLRQVLIQLSSRYRLSFNLYICRPINSCSLLTHNKLQYIFLIFLYVFAYIKLENTHM